jgi:transient receptor potential cation channel subfamily C protein 4
MTFIAHFLLEDIMDIIRHKWTFVSSFWSLYTFTLNLLMVVGGLTSIVGQEITDKEDLRAELSGNNPINIGQTLVAYGATMYCLRTVRWFLLNRSIGPVVVCTIRVIKDVVFVTAVFLVIYLSFGLGIWFMYKPFTPRGGSQETNATYCNTAYCIQDRTIKDNEGMRGVLSQMFWRVFNGDASEAYVQPKEEFNKPNQTKVFSLEFSHLMGLSMWAMYQGITVILLINILIALMNSTYGKFSQNVDAEWKYSKSYFQVCK